MLIFEIPGKSDDVPGRQDQCVETSLKPDAETLMYSNSLARVSKLPGLGSALDGTFVGFVREVTLEFPH